MFRTNSLVYSSIIFIALIIVDYVNDFHISKDIECQCVKLWSSFRSVVAGVEETGFFHDLLIWLIMIVKVLVLILILQVLSKVKFYSKRTRLDDLLDSTKLNLKTAHDILDKWKTHQTEYPITDDEADENRPMYLEVPILHVAIFESCSRKDLISEAGDSNSLFVT